MTTVAGRTEIDFSVYNPFDPEFVREPGEVFQRLLRDYPVAYHRDINVWMVAPHDLAAQVLKDPRFSTRFADWKDAPAPKPAAEWNLYDKVQQNSLGNSERDQHQRLRQLTAPAFGRKVMDQIEDRVRAAIAGVFDELPDPSRFNASEDIAVKVPIRAIAAMVGVEGRDAAIFEQGLGWNLVRASNPMYSREDRAAFAEAACPSLEHLLELIRERLAGPPSDDFLGTLVAARLGDDRLSDFEILTLVTSLIVAGSDTAVDLHTSFLLAIFENPAQRAMLREQPELMENAVIEVLRWSAFGKFGGLPRFPVEDIELGGELLEKGSFVMPLLSTAWQDASKWPDPTTFDVTRNHAGNLVFGAGPHLCIGLNLVKVQGKLMVQEFERRFGDRARIAGDLTYQNDHFNARRILDLPIEVAPA